MRLNGIKLKAVLALHLPGHTMAVIIFTSLFTGWTACSFEYPFLAPLHCNLLELEELFHIWYSHNHHPVSCGTVTICYRKLFNDSTSNTSIVLPITDNINSCNSITRVCHSLQDQNFPLQITSPRTAHSLLK